MIKVLHVGKFYHPYPGGIETVLRSLVRAIAYPGGIDLSVLVYNNAARTVTDRVDNIPVTRLASFGTVASQPICLNMPSRLARQRPDIVNVHLPNPLANLSILLARLQCPLVVTYHADIVRQKLVMIPYLMLLNKILRRADRIVVATPNHIKYSRVLGKYRDKCVVIPFGIDPSQFAPSPQVQNRRDQIRSADKRPSVLFIGRLVYYKGLRYLIESMKDVDARLVIIGSGPLEIELKLITNTLGLAGKITFLGRVSEEEKLAHLHACELLVLPSVEPSEAFGMTQLEAMACSKPVVSTDLPSGVPYVNRHGQTGLVVKPRDIRALSGAINRLLGDEHLRNKLGAAGRNLVETEYFEELMGQRYRRLYFEILSRRASAKHAPGYSHPPYQFQQTQAPLPTRRPGGHHPKRPSPQAMPTPETAAEAKSVSS